MARHRPPAILVLRQLAHFRAVLHAILLRATAVAERSGWTGRQHRPLIRQRRHRDTSQKDCHSNRLPEPASRWFHGLILEPGSECTDSSEDAMHVVLGVSRYCRFVPVLREVPLGSVNSAQEGYERGEVICFRSNEVIRCVRSNQRAFRIRFPLATPQNTKN